MLPASDVADPAAAAQGALRVAWARDNMPVLAGVRVRLEREQAFAGRRVGMCLHVRRKTAVLVETLVAGGAEVAVTGSPATTDDGVAAYLAGLPGVTVLAHRADGASEHRRHVDRVLDATPDVLVDNGADLIASALGRGLAIAAATEETTSGGHRLREELAGRVPFPVVVINDSPLKALFENVHGVGPTVVQGYLRATNRGVAATRFAVVGYGFCGRGIARSLRALGGEVTVVERSVVRALEAAFDGMRVAGLRTALGAADVVITVTGRTGVVSLEDILVLRDGAVLANAGHFAGEFDHAALERAAVDRRALDDHVTEYRLADGRRLRVLAGGEMLNLAAAGGNPIEIMDMGYALQAESLAALVAAPGSFVPGPQPVPAQVDRAVGLALLRSLGTVDLDPATALE